MASPGVQALPGPSSAAAGEKLSSCGVVKSGTKSTTSAPSTTSNGTCHARTLRVAVNWSYESLTWLHCAALCRCHVSTLGLRHHGGVASLVSIFFIAAYRLEALPGLSRPTP